MKKHFIKKYKVDTDIERKFEIQFNQQKFNLAYKWRKLPEASQAFHLLKKENMVTGRLRLKMLLLQMPFFHKALTNIKKIYLPKTSVSRL
jgi:hypothetical protein